MSKAKKAASWVGYVVVFLLIAFLLHPTEAMDFILK